MPIRCPKWVKMPAAPFVIVNSPYSLVGANESKSSRSGLCVVVKVEIKRLADEAISIDNWAFGGDHRIDDVGDVCQPAERLFDEGCYIHRSRSPS